MKPTIAASRMAVAALILAACSSAAATHAASEPVRVLVYNIHAGRDANGRDNLERVADLMRAIEVDVALLQEVDRRTQRSGGVDQPAELSRLTGLHAAFGKTLDYQGGEYGIAVLSRWPVTADTLLHLPVDPPQERAGGSHEPRGALRATIAAPTGPLVVINTHLDPSSDPRWREQEMRRLASIAAARSGGTLLVGGDMNSTPAAAEQLILHTAGLRDAWVECGRGDSFTYPADSATKRIDYLFLTGRTSCDAGRVLASDASDHRPVLFVVRPR